MNVISVGGLVAGGELGGNSKLVAGGELGGKLVAGGELTSRFI